MKPLYSQIEEAIARVVDPCSRFNGSRLSFIDLGMVDAIEVHDSGDVLIRLLLDDPTCLYLAEIHKEIREAVLSVPSVRRVDISLRADRLWTEELATETTQEKLRNLRAQRQAQFVSVESVRAEVDFRPAVPSRRGNHRCDSSADHDK